MQPTLRQHAARWLSATALGAALSLPLAHTAAASETLPPSLEQMQEIYLAFYLRPGDPGGLIYWAGVAARDFATVLTDFGRAEEARRLYGDINHATIGNAIDKIYMALFNARPDEAGKQYYIDGFMTGRFSAADLAYRILKGAQDGARPDLTAVRNKMTVANHFVRILDPELDGYDIQATYNAADEAPVREWMRKVTGTHTYSREQVREFIMNYVASANDPIRGGNGSLLRGRVIDGYLIGAKVFWDCNGNDKIDDYEIFTTSSDGGHYTIAKASSESCHLKAFIPGSAIDSDTGTSVLNSYVLYGTKNSNGIISPLTTLAALGEKPGGQSISPAEIRSNLRLQIALDTDYIANASGDAMHGRKVAKVAARLLQNKYDNIKGEYNPNSPQDVLNLLKDTVHQIQSVNFQEILNDSFGGVIDRVGIFYRSFTNDPTLGVQVDTVGLNGEQADYFKKFVADQEMRGNVGGGEILWEYLDVEELKLHYKKFYEMDIHSRYLKEESRKIYDEMIEKQRRLTEEWAKKVHSGNSVMVLDKETLIALSKIPGDIFKGVYSTAQVFGWPGVEVKLARVSVEMEKARQIMSRIHRIKDAISKTNAATAGIVEGLNQIENSLGKVNADNWIGSEDLVGAAIGVLKIIGAFGDIIEDDGIAAIPKIFSLSTGWSSLSSEQDAIALVSEFLDLVHTAIGLVPDPVLLSRVHGAIGVFSAAVSSYANGLVIKNQATNQFLVNQADADRWLKSMDLAIEKTYFSRMNRVLTGNVIVPAGLLPVPSVQSVSPIEVQVKEEVTFSVKGKNLPREAHLQFESASCLRHEMIEPDGTGFRQVCVFSEPGLKQGHVVANGIRIANTSVVAYEAARPEVDSMTLSNSGLGRWGKIEIIGKNFPENVRIVVLGKKDVCRDSVVTGTTTVEVHCFFEVPGVRAVQVLVGEEAILESPFRFEILKDENPVRPEIDSMSPLSAKVGEVTTFTFTGRNLTERVWFAIDGSNCFERNISSEQITMRCKLTKSGTLKVTAFEMGTAGNLGSWWLQVESEDASPMVESLSPERAKIGVPTRFTVKGRNLPGNTDLFVDDALECGPHTASPHEVSRVCTLQGAPGSRAVRVTVGGNFLWMLGVLPFEAVAADTAPQPVPGGGGKIPHTGITAQQCLTKKSIYDFVVCDSVEAIAFSGPGKQDGMRGHINAMGYREVPGFTRTECVIDNVTGLMWEGKTNDGGLRDGSKRYTNHADGRAGSALDYVRQVNAQGLCGYRDWRLPTVDELDGLVNFSKPYPGPTIDTAWFPNTASRRYWTGTPYAGDPAYSWVVHFNSGNANYDNGLDGGRAVRLVRASQ